MLALLIGAAVPLAAALRERLSGRLVGTANQADASRQWLNGGAGPRWRHFHNFPHSTADIRISGSRCEMGYKLFGSIRDLSRLAPLNS